MNESRVRPPAAAGRFYPQDPDQLAAMVDRLLAEAHPGRVEGRIVAALSPHAGYEFSGPATARLCRAMTGLEPDIVAVVGTAHFASQQGFFLDDHAAFRTPLGEVMLAQSETAELLKAGARISAQAHEEEHSIEVVLPFLQSAFKKKFSLLPIAANGKSLEDARRFGRTLAATLKGKKALIIAASDLSHYPPLSIARQVDPASLESFLTLDPEFLWRTEEFLMRLDIPNLHCAWCGSSAVAAIVSAAAALGADWGEPLACTNSADLGADDSQTVGYGAALLLERGQKRPWPTQDLSPEEKAELLALARESVQNRLKDKRLAPRLFDRPRFNLPAAVFVTWTEKNGELRGCIGATEPHDTLGNAVAKYAEISAFEDPRFPATTAQELAGLRAEISILSVPRPAKAEEITPGLGVIVGRGGRCGLFLPQVWEKLPDREEFMSSLCLHKAGLPADFWKRPEAELSIFTVAAFEET